jgi:hypothetical protein
MRPKTIPSAAAVQLLIGVIIILFLVSLSHNTSFNIPPTFVESYPEGAGIGDQHGKSPVHCAVGNDSTMLDMEIVNILLKACPNALRTRFVIFKSHIVRNN